MGAAELLARRLRAALRAEEPWAVEQLLSLGADPNLVLADGAAAVHLAARAGHQRGLRCLDALLRRGGDPNARSDEALTPLHVAAAWGCCPGLKLLLSRGADPQLRDRDGLRARDLAEQLGHHECVRVLREFAPCARTPSPDPHPDPDPDRAETPEGELQKMGPASSRTGTPDRTDVDRDGCRDVRPVAGQGPSGCLVHPQAVPDTSSDEASFVTAAEHPGPDPSPPAALLQRRLSGAGLGVQTEIPELELHARLQALTLASPRGHSRADNTKSCLDSAVAAAWQPGERAGAGEAPCGCSPRVPESYLELLRGLRELGASPGPVTPFTRPHYLRRLHEARAARGPNFSGHSPELAEALRTGRIPDAQEDEDALVRQFERPDPRRRWREGLAKGSFTYLLLDPRETQDLLSRASSLSLASRLRAFVRAIFYVGKGSRARPDAHLWEALGYQRRPTKQASPKVLRILDIWASGRGVVSLHCFQHAVAAEAYTREACLVAALGIGTLTNQKHGHCYGVAASWPHTRRCRLGVHLLHRALQIFLAEGQRELRPEDIQERG